MRHRRLSRSLASIIVVASSAGTIISMNACAGNEPSLDGVPPELDGGSTLTEGGGGSETADGGLDGSPDAMADADASVLCSPDGFCHLPVPTPDSLRAVWGDDVGTVWAVGAEGNILRWDGTALVVHQKVSSPLYAIWGSGPTDIWVAGESGIFHGQGATSASVTFTAAAYVPTVPIRSIHGFDPNDVWFVGGVSDWEREEGVVLRYTGPKGAAEPELEHDPIEAEGGGFTAVWGSSREDMWLASSTQFGQVARVFHGAGDGTGGTTFEEVEVKAEIPDLGLVLSEVVGGIHVPDTFIAGNISWFGFMYLGVVWSGATHPPDGDAGAVVWGNDDLWGEGWAFAVRGIYGTSRNDVWFVGETGRIRHFDGAKWSLARVTIDKMPFVEDLYGIWGGSKDIWVVGDKTVLRKSTEVKP